MPVSSENKRIAVNTVMLYIRMFGVMGISIYISRIVLATLGVTDFGIYSVISGIVVIFSFLQTVMASSVQRFLNVDLGAGNIQQLRKTFNSAFQIHFFIAIIVVVLGETLGLWFLNYRMEIPAERMSAANVIYQFSLLVCVFQMMLTPFSAIVTVHERMSILAYISFADVFLKLILVIIMSLSSFDNLIFYGLIMLFTTVIDFSLYFFYTRFKFEEVRLSFQVDMNQIRNIGSFAGWSMFGNFAYVMSTQGVNILLNLFFGPSVNAARAVTTQVQAAVTSFVYNFQIASVPQITKSYVTGNYHRMYALIYATSKMSFYLLLLVALPLFFKMPYVLGLWLKEVPDHTVVFTRLVLIYMLIDSISGGMTTSVNATGKIKKYQLLNSVITLLTLPISYLLLKVGLESECVYVVDIFVILTAQIVRIVIVLPIISLPYKEYFENVVYRIVSVVFIAVVPCYYINTISNNNFASLVIVCLCCTLIVATFVYLIGITKNERQMINKLVLDKVTKIANSQSLQK